jgi:hypothetical protein
MRRLRWRKLKHEPERLEATECGERKEISGRAEPSRVERQWEVLTGATEAVPHCH